MIVVRFCVMAGRTRHIRMQRSFRFLSETTKDVVSETTDFSKVDLSSECIENTVTGACYITGCPNFSVLTPALRFISLRVFGFAGVYTHQ